MGVLDDKDGKKYTHIIKTRTETLIGLKVLPKSIVSEYNNSDNRNLLIDHSEIKLLKNSQ